MRTAIRIRSRIPFDPMEHKSTSLAVHILLSLSELFLSHLSHQFTLSLHLFLCLSLSRPTPCFSSLLPLPRSHLVSPFPTQPVCSDPSRSGIRFLRLIITLLLLLRKSCFVLAQHAKQNNKTQQRKWRNGEAKEKSPANLKATTARRLPCGSPSLICSVVP